MERELAVESWSVPVESIVIVAVRILGPSAAGSSLIVGDAVVGISVDILVHGHAARVVFPTASTQSWQSVVVSDVIERSLTTIIMRHI